MAQLGDDGRGEKREKKRGDEVLGKQMKFRKKRGVKEKRRKREQK